MNRVLLYGDLKLDIVDGSSIWMASLIDALSRDDEIDLTVLVKTPITAGGWVERLTMTHPIELLDPFRHPDHADRLVGQKSLEIAQAVSILEREDAAEPADVVFVRSPDAIAHFAGRPGLTERTIFYSLGELDDACIEILNGARGIAAQTELLRDQYIRRGLPAARVFLLPPMIARAAREPRALAPGSLRLAYVGKLSADYCAIEMLECFGDELAAVRTLELHLAVGKVNRADGEEFLERVNQLLESPDPRLRVQRRLDRDQTADLIAACDVGLSWRSARYDDCLEISTKTLEYAAAGKPVILNRTPINERFFGADYPLYANTRSEFCRQVLAVQSSPDLYLRAARAVAAVGRRHVMPEVYFGFRRQFIGPAVVEPLDPVAAAQRHPIRIVFSCEGSYGTAKWKFVEGLIDEFRRDPRYQVVIDEWEPHNPARPEPPGLLEEKRGVLEAADILFCEWCNYNAIFFARHKRRHQVLVIRAHRYEFFRLYPGAIHWQNVDALICITEFLAYQARQIFAREAQGFPYGAFRTEDLVARFDIPRRRIHYIPNATRVDDFAPSAARDEHALRALGLLGWTPRIKRLDRALELLAQLNQRGGDFHLYVKGPGPEQFPPHHPDHEFFRELRAAHAEDDHVHFEPSGPPHEWFSKIGFILSLSDIEGSHQAAVEGALAGCIPIVARREGADHQFPDDLIFDREKQMADQVLHWSRNPAAFELQSLRLVQRYRTQFDVPVVVARLDSLFRRLLEDSGGGAKEWQFERENLVDRALARRATPRTG